MKKKASRFTIVARGQFNPVIFQPEWLVSQGLIPESDVDLDKVGMIHPELCDFSLDWVRFNVTRNRFQILSDREQLFEMTKDLFLNVFRLLGHTPVSLIGLNWEAVYRAPNSERWHNFGHLLAPKGPWGDLLANPGMRNLVMEESVRRDGLPGYYRVDISPGVSNDNVIVISINDHLAINGEIKRPSAEQMVEIVDSQWPKSMQRAEETFERLSNLI